RALLFRLRSSRDRRRYVKRFAVYDRPGIVLDERTGPIGADQFSRRIAGSAENRWTALCSMRIGGKKMHAIAAEQRVCRHLCRGAELSRNGHSGNLDVNSPLDEPSDNARVKLDLRVALRMHEDRTNPLQQQLIKELLGADRNCELRKLDEHVASCVNPGHPIVTGLLDDFM